MVSPAPPTDDVADLRDVLTANTAGLTADERYTLEHRYFNGQRTLQGIADSLGCTKEGVREAGLARLKSYEMCFRSSHRKICIFFTCRPIRSAR